jgi:hypothetical protein
MNTDKIRKNLATLIAEAEEIFASRHRTRNMITGEHSFIEYVDDVKVIGWYTNGLTLLKSIFGETSEHFIRAEAESRANYLESAQRFQAILKAAVTTLDMGYLFDIAALARADVEKTLIEQAEDLLGSNYYQPAAVLAGAVLEQHLRSMCTTYGISELKPDGKPKTLDPINNELAKSGAYDGITQKLITHLAGIRNTAAHGNTVSSDDAKRIVTEVLALCAKLR